MGLLVHDLLPHLVQALPRNPPSHPRQHADLDDLDLDLGDDYDVLGDDEAWRYDHIELVTFLIGASPSATTANVTLGAQGLARDQGLGQGLGPAKGQGEARKGENRNR